MTDDFTEQAEQIVNLVRSFKVEHDEAVSLVEQALRTAHSGGALEGCKEAGKNMTKALDRLVGGPQVEAVKRLVKAGA